MNKAIAGLLVATCCLSAFGQFFSNEEKAKIRDEEVTELKTSLPEASRKAVYIELCAAEQKAEQKANQFHPVKIHHTPEQRAVQQDKAAKSKAKLFSRYKQDIAKKHMITEQLLDEIEKTGKANEWPSGLEPPEEE